MSFATFLHGITLRILGRIVQFWNPDGDDLAWLDPPEDPRDTCAWDRYWDGLIEHGTGPPLFDLFCDDRPLINAMEGRESVRILCAANGFSMEPRALAAGGCAVTALDASHRALEIAQTFPPETDVLRRFIDPTMRRSGGSVDWVQGDVFDRATCPGPFDIVIERRTAQLYAPVDRMAFLDALAERTAADGLLLTHYHCGSWKPGKQLEHASQKWATKSGWAKWTGHLESKPPGRAVWLLTTTG